MVDGGGGGWATGGFFEFLKVEKNVLFGNISKITQYFFLIVSGPHRRVSKTSFGMFRIEKIGKFSNTKI